MTINVTCPFTQNSGNQSTLTANSPAFAGGRATLNRSAAGAAPGGTRYTGTARIAPRTSFTGTGSGLSAQRAPYHVTGDCGNGTAFRATLTVDPRTPTGGTTGGLGGSQGPTGVEVLAGGGMAAAAAAAGVLLLRRRNGVHPR
ncbi:hypothetical protein C6N75_03745 [Streptomyces solincola]|uniref:Uncharacterized protein n=1 Tax=Streptomyces solincola TaxID=2100817 RepID=A0A2S9Q1I9_9ACTN|nr:hypothetical protein C6N75_03745 [Streptomyces solincola]